ncbi:hypothetical protein [Mesorhizobium sp.]|uniref:hypothetical protein n=1 Tax=Mesorhizobium sp. TaxID=1871066 RepID=UPI00257AD3E5|nr:hypothetical protein [Mesorhizobium sp.]
MSTYSLACRDCALGLLQTAREAKKYGNTREVARLVNNARFYWRRYIWELQQ